MRQYSRSRRGAPGALGLPTSGPRREPWAAPGAAGSHHSHRGASTVGRFARPTRPITASSSPLPRAWSLTRPNFQSSSRPRSAWSAGPVVRGATIRGVSGRVPRLGRRSLSMQLMAESLRLGESSLSEGLRSRGPGRHGFPRRVASTREVLGRSASAVRREVLDRHDMLGDVLVARRIGEGRGDVVAHRPGPGALHPPGPRPLRAPSAAALIRCSHREPCHCTGQSQGHTEDHPSRDADHRWNYSRRLLFVLRARRGRRRAHRLVLVRSVSNSNRLVIKGIPRPEGRRSTTCGSPGLLDAPARCDSWRYHSDWGRAVVSGPIHDRGPRTLSALAGDGDDARGHAPCGTRVICRPMPHGSPPLTPLGPSLPCSAATRGVTGCGWFFRRPHPVGLRQICP